MNIALVDLIAEADCTSLTDRDTSTSDDDIVDARTVGGFSLCVDTRCIYIPSIAPSVLLITKIIVRTLNYQFESKQSPKRCIV